ncbi:MAG TPA: ATP-binding protein, partial [Allocoleopsis sp.]
TVPKLIISGEKAIEEAEKIQPDLILMDIMLKGEINGIEAAEVIRNKLKIPVVYLTAHTDESTLEKAKKTEPFGYIVKPFEERELHTTIEIALTRYEAEKQIKEIAKKQQELYELKSQFVSMVSHEFRTPLATILFSADILERYDFSTLENKKNNHINRIRAAVHQMTDLLEDVIEIGQAELGKTAFSPISLDLEKFCLDLMEEITFAYKQRQIILNYSGEKNVLMDDKLLHKILGNLLTNAIKYSPEEQPVNFTINICHNLSEIQQSISFIDTNILIDDYPVAIFEIKDYGIGIPEPEQKYMFEMFYRSSNIGKISGTGLGLAIVKNCVELHQGQIFLNSVVNEGTTFVVILPIFANLTTNL